MTTEELEELALLVYEATALTPYPQPTKIEDFFIMPRPLTDKEQKVIDAFESAQPGLGKLAEANILNPNSGYAEIIADMDGADIKVSNGTASNSFMYRRIGG
jgi:hypothetical protein